MNTQREMKLYTGCKTFGYIDVMKEFCTDPECTNCANFRKELNKAFKKEIEKYAQN